MTAFRLLNDQIILRLLHSYTVGLTTKFIDVFKSWRKEDDAPALSEASNSHVSFKNNKISLDFFYQLVIHYSVS
jgi:hypothetical protein